MKKIKTDKIKILGRPYYKKRNTIQALTLRKAGMSYDKIAKIQGVTHNTIRSDIDKLNALIPNNTMLEQIDHVKVPLLKGTMVRLLEGINAEDKIDKATTNNLAYAFTQIHNALRLEEGKSTSNISYADALAKLKSAKRELGMLNDSNQGARESAQSETFTIPVVQERQ
jgi:predicted transcriptional regulator